MFRYVAFAWQPSDRTAAAHASALRDQLLGVSAHWRNALDAQGIRVLCTGERRPTFVATPLANSTGVVLGAVFARAPDNADSPAPCARFDARESAAIVDSGGKRLIDRYWGNYVAVLKTGDAAGVLILNDPTGSLPCFITTQGAVHIVLSCITDGLAMGLHFKLNESYLRQCVLSGGRNQQIVPLENLTRVYGGESISIVLNRTSRFSRRQLWNPLTFTERNEAIENPAQAAELVRQVVRQSTRSWTMGHEQVLHRLSGGLDSSIVLACLGTAAAHITCCTYYDANGAMDERPWARLAAQSVRCDHIERAFDASATRLPDVFAMRPLVYPTSYIGCLFRSALDRDLTELTGAALVFSGDGGDSGFCSDSVGLAVAEYLRAYGLRPFALKLAAQVGLRVELSAWAVLGRSMRRWLKGSRMSDQREGLLLGAGLVSKDLREAFVEAENYPHPWFNAVRDIPWAVIRRMGQLVYAPEFYDPSMHPDDPAPALIAPLYSQPVIEALLRIPMHVHFLGGRDRGLARHAFDGAVPAPILRRTWKDAAPGYFDKVLASNREFLRSLLLDGVLVNRGLLDRGAVEQALSAEAPQLRVLPGEILKHMDTEVWARAWL